MIPQVLVAEKTVAQLRTPIVRLLPQAGKLPYGRLGVVPSHEAESRDCSPPPPYREPRHLPRDLWSLVV